MFGINFNVAYIIKPVSMWGYCTLWDHFDLLFFFSFSFPQCPEIVFSNCSIYFVEIGTSHVSKYITFRKMNIFELLLCAFVTVWKVWLQRCLMYIFGTLPLKAYKDIWNQIYFIKVILWNLTQMNGFLSSLPDISRRMYLKNNRTVWVGREL